jgi:hypothetical protein
MKFGRPTLVTFTLKDSPGHAMSARSGSGGSNRLDVHSK